MYRILPGHHLRANINSYTISDYIAESNPKSNIHAVGFCVEQSVNPCDICTFCHLQEYGLPLEHRRYYDDPVYDACTCSTAYDEENHTAGNQNCIDGNPNIFTKIYYLAKVFTKKYPDGKLYLIYITYYGTYYGTTDDNILENAFDNGDIQSYPLNMKTEDEGAGAGAGSAAATESTDLKYPQNILDFTNDNDFVWGNTLINPFPTNHQYTEKKNLDMIEQALCKLEHISDIKKKIDDNSTR